MSYFHGHLICQHQYRSVTNLSNYILIASFQHVCAIRSVSIYIKIPYLSHFLWFLTTPLKPFFIIYMISIQTICSLYDSNMRTGLPYISCSHYILPDNNTLIGLHYNSCKSTYVAFFIPIQGIYFPMIFLVIIPH